ncbi:hypothetical protein MMC13_003700 [Lambiella insularis]|nr:hypothetical protein [Lambiella insularis]
MLASPGVAASVSVQNDSTKPAGASLDSSPKAELDSDSGLFEDTSPTPFPCLTGLRSRPAGGKQESVTLGSKVTLVDLYDATASLGASPISALQAAWAVILSTYTATQDAVTFTTLIASPASHNPSILTEDAFHEISTRVCLGAPQQWGQATNGSVLKRLTLSSALGLRQSEQPVGSAARQGDARKHGTVIVLTDNGHSKDDNGIPGSIKGFSQEERHAVNLVARPSTAGYLELKVLYENLVLNEPSAFVLLQQLDDILAFVLASPSKPIVDSLAAVRTSLLSISNEPPEEATESDLQPLQLHAQFEKFARHSPHRVALDFRRDIHLEQSSNNTTWTFEQLNDRAETFAAYLIHRYGELADEVIPICMERCPELYVAILGILKAGGAWCPIDASFPARRRHDLIARTGARLLVVAEREVVDTKSIPQGVVTVDITCPDAQLADHIEPSEIKKGSLAYLIWTSGTTGDPKGVPIHHQAAVTSMKALQKSIPVDVTRGVVRCLQFSQFTFDVFVQDLFYTWGVGGTIISATREIMLGSFADLATKTNATHAHLTPAFAASVPRERCPTLEVITMIGEKLSQAVADDWSQSIRAYNTYGPAEATVVSTLRQFGAAGNEIKSENIGFPLASVSAFVMRNGLPIMRQGIGELALGGPHLSKGYWNDPSRSSESFVWNDHYCRRLYMTGDMVRQLHDGSLEFVGRTDDLIKIQGIRVELSEISFSLRSCHPLVEQVEIQYLDRPDRPSKVVVAFLAAPKLASTEGPIHRLVASEEAILIAKIALAEAQKSLPDYMVPSVFLVISSIPRTTSAKTDRAILKSIYSTVDLGAWETALASNDNKVEDVLTWSTREADLIRIIAGLSGTSRVSMSRASDLRSIGIDSIAALRLAQMLNNEGFPHSVTDILQSQRLDDLLKVTDKSGIIHQTQTYDLETFNNEWHRWIRKAIGRSNVFVAPALPLQESLLSESMQNASAYWSNVFFSLDAQTNISRLHRSWLQVVKDTEALRTGFIPSATISELRGVASVSRSVFMQLIYDEVDIDWKCMKSSEADLKDLAMERANAVALRHQRDHFREPLLAVTVFELPNHRLMMISVHHAVRDDASLDLILEDVDRSYRKIGGRSKGRHQLREALQVMLPTDSQIALNDEFWSKSLDDFACGDGASIWPDLTGKNTRRKDLAAGFIVHIQTLRTPYKDLQVAALSLGASSAASILRVAWGSVLLEYLETDKVVFAETWSNRVDNFGLADIVGPLMTVFPVPFRALGTAREALTAQAEFQSESRAHHSVHPRIVRKILGRSENQALYPAVFNFLPDLRHQCPEGSFSLWQKSENILGLTVEHPMALNVTQAGNGILEMELLASPNIMSSAHLAILARQVDAFVEAMLELPDTPIMQLSSHFPKDLLSVTSVGFSDNVKAAWKQSPTHWVDHYASMHPHWLAAQVVTFFDEHNCVSEGWSFTELRSAYDRVAAFIFRSGCVDRMIAVCLDRRLEAYAVILGIIASGNTYLPIDEDLPGERKSFLLQDSTAAMLFTTRPLALTFSSTRPDCHVIYVDDSAYIEQMADGHSARLSTYPKASNNAYLLYTSGSTGVPKGVLVGRGNLCSFIEGLSEFICPLIPGMKELPGKGKYLGLASRAFDVHIAEMFLAWRQGLAAVTAPRTMLLDNLELALRELKITHASFVPSLIDQAGLDPANLPDLHYLGVGGEKMSKRVIDTWASNENAALVNAYGPTEMSIGCTAAEVTRESNLRNVGRPYGNSVAHILVPGSNDYTLRCVAGELCFTGDLVANGYHNRPDAYGFVGDFNGEKMYRTGDIVRLMSDDSLEYLRREDDQIKVRGQRLELGEITEAIRSLAVRILGLDKVDVATMVAQHPKLSRPQLVSFVASISPSHKPIEYPEILCSAYDRTISSKIRADCQKVLPAYMVPDVVIPLTRLPLALSSGKADLKRLKLLFTDTPIAEMIPQPSEYLDHSDSSRRELTEAESSVRSLVMTILAVDAAELSSDTNIFRLGLDSLNAISLAIKMQKLGYDCTISSVLRNPTLEQLALLPRKGQEKGAPANTLTQTRSMLADLEFRFRAIHSHGLNDSSILAIRPCLPLQETLVATSLSSKTHTLYVNHMTLRLRIGIDHAHLYRAWARVVADHDILRTCFQEFESGIAQIVLGYDQIRSLHWKDTVSLDPYSASQLQQSKSAADIISHIESRAPMRLNLFRPHANDRSSVLLISIHHALYDRESMAMVLEELSMRYHSVTPSAHTPFECIIEHACSQDQRASEIFWKQYLAQYRRTPIIDRAHVTNATPSNSPLPIVDRILASPLTELESLSSAISGTLTSTIQAVFGVILAQTLGTHDVVFGTVLSGRLVSIESPHTIIAPCITTIPQRVTLRNEHTTIIDIVKVAQQGFVDSIEFQHTALRHIHRWLGAEAPLFDCLVSCTSKADSTPSPSSRLWTELESSMPDDFPFSVEFEADHEADRLRVHCAFSSAFGDLKRAASFLEDIDLLLGALVRQENITTEHLKFSYGSTLNSRSKSQIWDTSQWSPKELEMRGIAAEICGISAKDISKEASFFSIGIDSITAIRFARRLKQSGMECSSADVMRYSCIAALAQRIDAISLDVNNISKLTKEQQEDNLKRLIAEIPILSPSDTITNAYVCTPLQSSMLTQTLGSDGRLYFNHHAVQLAPHVDLLRLKEALGRLMMTTEILRTSFHFSEEINSWLAAVHQECPYAWAEYNTRTGISDSLAKIMKQSVLRDEADFEQLPWKTCILRTASEIVLVISMHHSLYDGVSISLLFQDLARLYRGIDLQPRIPFSDAAKAVSRSNVGAEEYWLKRLYGFGSTEVSRSLQGPDTDEIEVETTLNSNSEDILRSCKYIGVTLQTVALLAFAKSLACVSGRRDVVFGHVIGGRSFTMPGVDEVIGPLLNTIPSRVIFDKTYVTNKTAAIDIQQSSGESQPHQHASLGRIQQSWRQKVGNANAELFDTLFVFQNTLNKVSSTNGLWTFLDIGQAAGRTEYSTNFELEHGEERIILRIVSRQGLMKQEKLCLWLTDFEQIFQDILDHPQRSVMAFPALLQSLPLALGSKQSHSHPQDEIESGPDLDLIRIVLSEISGISLEDITPNASIFSLGLDSISAIQIAATCRRHGYAVSVADVLQGRSLGGICRRLRDRSPDQDSHVKKRSTLISTESRSKALVLANRKDEDIEAVLPCLAGQIYHLATWLKSGRRMCEGIWMYQCSQRISVDDLKSSWRQLRERHSVLRTMFVAPSPEEAVQVVLKGHALNNDSFECLETSSILKDRILDLVKQEAKQPFNFLSPLSKLCLVRGGTHDFIVLKLHHVTYDAWTLRTIVEDLIALYHNVHLPSGPRFGSFIYHTLRSLHTEPEKLYWRRSLNHCQQTLLWPQNTSRDNDIPTSINLTPTILSINSAIPHLQALETVCHQSSISLPTIVLLAFARTLARHESITNPTFGLYQAGRSASFKDIEQLCAPCLNVTAVVIPDALDRPALESAQNLQRDLAERVAFEQSYLHEVLQWVGCGGKPLFNTFVNILSHEGARSRPFTSPTSGVHNDSTPFLLPCELGEVPVDAEPMPQGRTAVDGLEVGFLADKNLYLDVARSVENDCVDFGIRCDGELMDEEAVRVFARKIAREVEEIVEGMERERVKGLGQ